MCCTATEALGTPSPWEREVGARSRDIRFLCEACSLTRSSKLSGERADTHAFIHSLCLLQAESQALGKTVGNG